MRNASEVSDASPVPDHIMRHLKHPGPAFTFTRGAGFGEESFIFSHPVDDELQGRVEQLIEICKLPEGRAMMERELTRTLRGCGADALFDLPYVSDDNSSDEMSCSDGAYRFTSPPPIIPEKRAANLDPQEPQISAKKAKRWLESM